MSKHITIDHILSELEVLLLKRDEQSELEKLRLQTTHRDRTIADLYDANANLKEQNATLKKLRSNASNKGYPPLATTGDESELEVDARLGRMIRNMPIRSVLMRSTYGGYNLEVDDRGNFGYYTDPETAFESAGIADGQHSDK